MVTLAQRMEALRTERGLSRPALATALNLPRMAVEKFETGRQTPSQAQQEQLAAFFGVSLFYLRGESADRTQTEDWMSGAYSDEPAAPAARVERAPAPAAPNEDSPLFGAFLRSKKFQETLRGTVLEVLRSPEGQDLLAKAVRKELQKR